MTYTVEYPSDQLDLPLCVNSGQTFRWQTVEDGSWIGVDGPHWFVVQILADRYNIESNANEQAFRALFQLDIDGESVHQEIVARAPELAPYMTQLRGLRVMRFSDPYEVLFTFLCTANNHIKRITPMVRKLASYGLAFDAATPIVLHRWPSVEVIAGISEETLRAQGFGYRAKTIPAVAQRLLTKPPNWLESLKEADYQAAHDELLTLPGVGKKLADCVCLFGLHHGESAPIDTHMWQAAVRLWFPEWKDKAVTDARYRQLGAFLRDRFGNLAGWAQQHLFYENVVNWRTRK